MKIIQVLALLVLLAIGGCMTGGAPYFESSNGGNYGSVGLPGLGNYSWNGNNGPNYGQGRSSSWSINNGSFRWDGPNGGVYWGNNGSPVVVPRAPDVGGLIPQR